jgi:hypothetical protein
MAIRGHHIGFDISTELQSILRKNGLEAHIVQDYDGKLYLEAQGRNYPYNRYEITRQQAEAMSLWGYNSTNTKAYNTLKHILKDADMPRALVVARQAGGLVNMGQWGQRMTPERAGFFPRQRFGGLYNPGYMSRPVASFPGDRLAPGTMRSFDYRSPGLRPTTGVYWKGERRQYESEDQMPDRVKVTVTPEKPRAAERPEPGKAVALTDHYMNPVYFSPEHWRQVLDSHGIVIDEANKKMIIKSSGARLNYSYDLTDQEIAKILNPKLEPDGVSIKERLDIINNNVNFKKDFESGITVDMLKSNDIIDVKLTPAAREKFEYKFEEYDRWMEQQKMLTEAKEAARSQFMAQEGRIRRDPAAISGREIGAILGGYGWYNAEEHGREVVVAEIRVDNLKEAINSVVMPDGRVMTAEELQKEMATLGPEDQEYAKTIQDRLQKLMDENKDAKDKFVMSAVINGEIVSHEISRKDYEKFMRYDDEHRLKLFDSIFGEVSIQKSEGVREGRPDDVFLADDGRTFVTREEMDIQRSKSTGVDGQDLRDLNYKKGFYREGSHGREVTVDAIKVEPDPQKEGNYKMTAVINGQSITHDISQKQYDKFLVVDDMQRLKMFSKIFNEVDMKIRPEHKPNVGAMLMAGLVGITQAAHMVTDIAMGMPPGPRPPHMAPEIYESSSLRNVPTRSVSASDLASANFESGDQERRESENISQSQGTGRGV